MGEVMLKPIRDEVLVEVMGIDSIIDTGDKGSPRARVVSVSEKVASMKDSVKPGDVVLIPETKPELKAGSLVRMHEREILGVLEAA